MFKNVLVGVDGRVNGRDAIALAARLIDPEGKLTLAHVHDGELEPANAIIPGLVVQEREASLKLLEAERAATGIEAELVSLIAMSPGGALHRQAEKQGADLLVVGSCGRGAFGRTMLGDDTRAALNGASCAVAVAPTGYAQHLSPLNKVGLGYDGSPESRAALAFAHELAASSGAEVHALEVVSLPSVLGFSGLMAPAIGASIEMMLQEAGARMQALPDVIGSAVYGLTGEELAAFGDEVDILIVGSRGYGPVKRLVLGSTANYLERHARCALLVLPRVATADSPGDGAPSTATRVGAAA
jgi:nucleotide-binding universal stress UspA family protein